MRQARKIKKGADYHVVGVINNRENHLSSKQIKKIYVQVLKECRKKYLFLILNFVIMNNHIHLMVRPGEKESISVIMQWINSVFAMRFNKISGRCGHVWNDRFWSKVIDSIEQFLQIYDYISRNPVKAGLSIVPEEYEFCGEYHIKKNIRDIITPFWEAGFSNY